MAGESEIPPDGEGDHGGDVGSDYEPGPPDRCISLPTTEDGWLVVAPEKRRVYRREIEQAGDKVVPGTAAEKERVSGLVVREYAFDPRGQGRQTDNRPSFSKIWLVNMLPKESERQRQLQQQQQLDLERTQEIPDRLFNDPGAARNAKKRGAGGMRAYLTQSTAKKGRGRRKGGDCVCLLFRCHGGTG